MTDQSKHQKYVKNNIIMLVGRIVAVIFLVFVLIDSIHRHRFSLGPNRGIRLETSPANYYFMMTCFVLGICAFIYGVFQSARNLVQARRGNIDGEL
jgi:formate hydrogenlyase subunit 3/multisubunit Na+/H+ antiporter MnhD subunit